MSEHVEGKPVSPHTYVNHGCRCSECTEARRVYMRKMRQKPGGTRQAMLAYARAQNAAATEFKKLHPERWREILAQKRREVQL